MATEPRTYNSSPGLKWKHNASHLERRNMLVDGYSRRFRYLRLSLTEKCNFRCEYCLPETLQSHNANSFLNLNEIKNLALAIQDLGVEKIRLTGGEPLLRKDLLEIIRLLKNETGVSHVAMTTNGFSLEKSAENLKKSGLDSVNISLDSLDEKKFKTISGANSSRLVLRGIEKCLELDFEKVKVNCVLLKGLNDSEFQGFVDYIKDRPLSFRFIELMRTGSNQEYFERHHFSISSFQKKLIDEGWTLANKARTDGPANEYTAPFAKGRMGFISAYSKNFCSNCNRLRISAKGRLRLCLFGETDLDLRDYLQRQDQGELLKHKISTALSAKPLQHNLHQNNSGNMNSLSTIGG